MSQSEPEPQQAALNEETLGWALCFEFGLGLLALLIGRLISVWPAEQLEWPPSFWNLLMGAALSAPAIAVMLAIRHANSDFFAELREVVDTRVAPLFANLSVTDAAILSLTAGWGEEVLFRGLIQSGITQSLGIVPGLIISGLLFGLVHFVSPGYFAVAFGMSLFLGAIFHVSGSLWVPIVTHAVYDFVMLLYLNRQSQQSEDIAAADDAAAEEAE